MPNALTAGFDQTHSTRKCHYMRELNLETLVWTRGRKMPLSDLKDRMMCPQCGGRRSVSFLIRSRPFEFATLGEWVDWFNNRRLLEPIGNIPPAEAEERYYTMTKQPPWRRDFKRNSLRETRGGSVPRGLQKGS